jgi:hypothetical protein
MNDKDEKMKVNDMHILDQAKFKNPKESVRKSEDD